MLRSHIRTQHTRRYTPIHTHTHMHAHTCTHTHAHTHTHGHAHAHTHTVHAHTHMYLMFSSIICRAVFTSGCDTGCHNDTDLASNLHGLYKDCSLLLVGPDE